MVRRSKYNFFFYGSHLFPPFLYPSFCNVSTDILVYQHKFLDQIMDTGLWTHFIQGMLFFYFQDELIYQLVFSLLHLRLKNLNTFHQFYSDLVPVTCVEMGFSCSLVCFLMF